MEVREESSPREVITTEDGTMFLYGGRHEVARLFSGQRDPGTQSPRIFVENINSRKDFCESRTIEYQAFIFPDKMYMLRKHLPEDTSMSSIYLRCYRSGAHWVEGTPCTYLEGALLRSRQPFPKTDTHYSAEGNFNCCIEMLARIFPESIESFRGFFQDHGSTNYKYSGDLGRKMDPPITEVVATYNPRKMVQQESNGVASGNDGLLIIARNPTSVSNKRLLLFADSYFRALIPYLSYFFTEIVFCRTRFFHPEIVRSCAPDYVFSGMAERYLSDCVPDSVAPSFLAYPLMKGQSTQPTKGFSQVFAETFNDGKII